MMMNKLSCAIVQDLLPSYADGMVSAETQAAVDAHLEACPACWDMLRRMQEGEKEADSTARDVDYLKKVRRSGRRWTLVVGLVLMLLGLSMTLFTGNQAGPDDVLCRVTVDGQQVHIAAESVSSGQRVARVAFSNAGGMVEVRVYTSARLFLPANVYEADYTVPETVTQVRVGNIILWEEGQEISRRAAKLYAAQHPYIGDMPSNATVAALTGVSEHLGGYTNELQTARQPYGWTLRLEDTIPEAGEELALQHMKADACVLLAAIENLGYVTWSYQTEAQEKTFTWTQSDASELCGEEIKSFFDTASGVQRLLNRMGNR